MLPMGQLVGLGTRWSFGGSGQSSSLQRDRQALPNLGRSLLDDLRGEQVQCSVDIFLSVLIENTPGAALRHAFHGRQLVKGWNRHFYVDTRLLRAIYVSCMANLFPVCRHARKVPSYSRTKCLISGSEELRNRGTEEVVIHTICFCKTRDQGGNRKVWEFSFWEGASVGSIIAHFLTSPISLTL